MRAEVFSSDTGVHERAGERFAVGDVLAFQGEPRLGRKDVERIWGYSTIETHGIKSAGRHGEAKGRAHHVSRGAAARGAVAGEGAGGERPVGEVSRVGRDGHLQPRIARPLFQYPFADISAGPTPLASRRSRRARTTRDSANTYRWRSASGRAISSSAGARSSAVPGSRPSRTSQRTSTAGGSGWRSAASAISMIAVISVDGGSAAAISAIAGIADSSPTKTCRAAGANGTFPRGPKISRLSPGCAASAHLAPGPCP